MRSHRLLPYLLMLAALSCDGQLPTARVESATPVVQEIDLSAALEEVEPYLARAGARVGEAKTQVQKEAVVTEAQQKLKQLLDNRRVTLHFAVRDVSMISSSTACITLQTPQPLPYFQKPANQRSMDLSSLMSTVCVKMTREQAGQLQPGTPVKFVAQTKCYSQFQVDLPVAALFGGVPTTVDIMAITASKIPLLGVVRTDRWFCVIGDTADK